MSEEKRLVPYRRFKGFTNDWEQRKFKDSISKIGDGLHGTPKYNDNGEVFFINGNNLLQGKVIINVDTKKVDINQQSKDDKFLDDTTILLSLNGTIGSLAYYNNENLMLGKSVAFINVNNCDKNFIYCYLQSPSTQSYFESNITGSTIKNLGLKSIREMNIFIPKNKDEQISIGRSFLNFDNLITLHQRKLDKLKDLKKSYLSKMFPAEGQRKPELRFKGFTGDWEQRKLGEVSSLYQPSTISSQDIINYGYPVFGANGYIGYFDQYNHFMDQVTVSARGENTGTPSYVEGPVWITGNSMVVNIDNKKDISKKFLYSNLCSKSLKSLITGGAQPQLTRNILSLFMVNIPSISEQNNIGEFLFKINSIITLHQRKLDKLKNLKKAYLNEMFV